MKRMINKKKLEAHKSKLLLVGLAVLILSITAVGYISTRNQVFIEDGKETLEVQTRKETVEEVLAEAEVDYLDEDHITPGLNTLIEDEMTIQIIRAQNITIFDDDEMYALLTPVYTVEEALIEAGIIIEPDDKVAPSKGTPLKEGMEIEINRAVPCEIIVDGDIIELNTIKETVEEVLTQAEVELGKKDLLNYDLKDSITEDMTIEVIRVEKEVITEVEAIDFKTVRQNDKNLEKGKSRVEQEGKNGEKQIVTEITYENGEEVERVIVSEEITKEPLNRVVKVGTKAPKPAPVVSRGGSTVTRTLRVEATAYTSQDPGVGNITATGARLRHGIIAVDPRVIPLGTKIYVPGYGYGVAADTGGAIIGNKIDLAYENRNEALRFGRRMLTIKIYD